MKNNSQDKKNIIVTSAVVTSLSFMTVGFAAYDKELQFLGNVAVQKLGIVEITNISLINSSNLYSSSAPTFDNGQAEFHVVFQGTGSSSDVYKAVYQIEIFNGSFKDYVYSGFNYNPTVTITSGTGEGTLEVITEGINNGDIIQSGSSKSFTVTLYLNATDNNSTYSTDLTTNLDFSVENTGSLVGSISPLVGDLTGNNKLAPFNLEVINTFNYDRDFILNLSDSNFSIVDANGNNIETLNIGANETKSYSFFIKANEDSVFLTNSYPVVMVMSSAGIDNVNIGTINLSVDIYEEKDTSKVEVGNATLSIDDTNGTFIANWDRIDTGGTSVKNYTLMLYKDDVLLETVNTNSGLTSYTFTGMEEGNYYFIVYGEDEAGNTGLNDINNATTANGYATKSDSTQMKWIFNVTYSLSNLTHNGASTAELNKSYSVTLSTTSTNYQLPSSVTITMDGVILSVNDDYTYNSSTGLITINKVTSDVTIEATGNWNICLVKGTKIRLSDGTTKNIEEITYNDLLQVYSYELGRIVFEYPIWIEKTNFTNYYQKIIFSDGEELKTVGFHGVYNLDINEFVSVIDKEKFYVGSSIAKIDEDGKIKRVKVVSIEYVEEEVQYYHVVSTRYYNVIANNILTTDGTTILSNLYGFNDDLTWKNPNFDDLYSYDEFDDFMPYYMFKGLRVEEGKNLIKFGLSKEVFKDYLQKNQLNPHMILEPNKVNNRRIWKVKTSDDEEVEVYEGETYILKEPKNKENFIGWYYTGDNKYYLPNDKITIWFGSYFEAIYK